MGLFGLFGSKEYECPECGSEMHLEGDEVICYNCGYSVDEDEYGVDYDEMYPTKADVLIELGEYDGEDDEDDDEETYEYDPDLDGRYDDD